MPVSEMKGVNQAEVPCDLPRRSKVGIGCDVSAANGSEIRVVRCKVPGYHAAECLSIVVDIQVAAGIHELSGQLETGYKVRLKADLLGWGIQARSPMRRVGVKGIAT